MSNPHDALFKAVFGDPEHARGALRAVVPAVLAEALDWPTLVRRPGSFVDPVLREQHTDLLFSATWRDGGGEALVYFLFEHQSTPGDGLMAYRLLCYDVLREVARAAHGLEALALVMRYILEVNEHVEPEALQALLEREVGTEAKDTIVTAGQRLIEQGHQQGHQQGFQQGECALLLRLLRRRFGDEVDTNIEQRITTASIEQIDTWTERVLSAATLTELLAD
jgi:predicted transposase YdaD